MTKYRTEEGALKEAFALTENIRFSVLPNSAVARKTN